MSNFILNEQALDLIDTAVKDHAYSAEASNYVHTGCADCTAVCGANCSNTCYAYCQNLGSSPNA